MTVFTAEDVRKLCPNKNAREFEPPEGTSFAPGALDLLKDLPKLLFVQVVGCKLTESDLLAFGEIRKLARLNLDETNVQDDWLRHIVKIPVISDLWLNNTPVTDRGLEHVAKMTALDRSLDLRGTKVTDAGMSFLTSLVKLRTINLIDTRVTDSGILPLAINTRLGILYKRSEITEAGIDAFLADQRRQRRIASGGPQTECKGKLGDPDVDEAHAVLQSFFVAICAWNEAALKTRTPNAVKVMAIFKEHTVPKPRIGFLPNSISYGGPQQYPADGKMEWAEILRPSGSRLEFLSRPFGQLNSRYRFVMLKKSGHWLIDSRFTWRNGWDPSGL